MQKLLLLVTVTFIISCNSSTKKGAKDEISLEQRLDEFMRYTEEMHLDKVMDYIYPKLFTIAPRKDVKKAMEDIYFTDELSIDLDSVKLEKLHPEFEEGGGRYARVDYSMLMIMKLKDKTIANNESQQELVIANLEADFGKENIRYDKASNSFRIYNKSTSIAVKDKYAKEWSFAELNKDDPEMLRKLFSKEVLEKLETYN